MSLSSKELRGYKNSTLIALVKYWLKQSDNYLKYRASNDIFELGKPNN